MELFEAFDSTMAEILGENEYELLSKQAKVSAFLTSFAHIHTPPPPASLPAPPLASSQYSTAPPPINHCRTAQFPHPMLLQTSMHCTNYLKDLCKPARINHSSYQPSPSSFT